MISSQNLQAAPEGADNNEPLKIILAEDDTEDQELFLDALEQAQVPLRIFLLRKINPILWKAFG